MITALIRHGSVWNDAVLLAEAHGAAEDAARLAETAELAEALAGSKERHQETMLLGEAFLRRQGLAAFGLFPSCRAKACLVRWRLVRWAGAHGISREKAVAAFLHALASVDAVGRHSARSDRTG